MRFFVTLASTTQNIGCPSIMTPSKMGKTKNLIFYSHSLLELCYFLHFISGIYLSKILLHHFIDFIWIITPLMKINVSIQETKLIMWRSGKFHLRTDVSHDTRCSSTLNTQLPRVTAERAIHYIIVIDGRSLGQSQWNFLLTS